MEVKDFVHYNSISFSPYFSKVKLHSLQKAGRRKEEGGQVDLTTIVPLCSQYFGKEGSESDAK